MSLGSNDDNLARLYHGERRLIAGIVNGLLLTVGLITVLIVGWLVVWAIQDAMHVAATDTARCGTECAAWAEAGDLRP